jgi:hypothetical protein
MNEKQQQIVALRGQFVTKCLLRVGAWSVYGNGYENYPEPQWYMVKKGFDVVSESYWDTDALEIAIKADTEKTGSADLWRTWIKLREDIVW